MPDAPARTIPVIRPEPGRYAEVAILPDRIYALDFDPADVLFEPDGADILLTFPDGGRLTLKSFAAASLQGQVLIELPDGLRVAGSDLVDSLAAVLHDFRTNQEDYGLSAVLQEDVPEPLLPSIPRDAFELMLEPDGKAVAPLCEAFCPLGHDSGHPDHGPFADEAGQSAADDYFITPLAPSPAERSSPAISGHKGLPFPGTEVPASALPEPLLLRDVLDPPEQSLPLPPHDIPSSLPDQDQAATASFPEAACGDHAAPTASQDDTALLLFFHGLV